MIQPTPGIRTFDATAISLAFPLGGIGTGTVSLGARGDLRDWEIFNKPAKGTRLPNIFFALRVQSGEREPMARVLEGPIQPPFTQSHGYHPILNAGLPRMEQTTFRGEYPFATVTFHEPSLPVAVQLEVFNPLIPLNPEDSGIPCAILTFTVTNITDLPVRLTLAGSLANPVGGIQFDPYGNLLANRTGHSTNQFRQETGFSGLYMDAADIPLESLDFGMLSLVTSHPNVTVKPVWLRGAWYDFLREFWDDFTSDGLLEDLGYDSPSSDGKPDTGTLGVLDTLGPGDSRSYRFVLTWYFPNRPNSWQADAHKTIRNHYATRFEDAWDVARYLMREIERLETQTQQFHDALFSSTLPPYVLDALSANIVPLRSNTCFWLEDGRFYGWEGCFDTEGCCPGTCTHVWSYVQTVAYLFPSLEREMRRIEFVVETKPDGHMSFRNFQSFGEDFVGMWSNIQDVAAVDGQLGSILRAYREWQLSGDSDWLQAVWPGVKNALNFASAHWDTDQDYVLDGKQHNTYDIEFYGPNPLSGIYYLAALRAVEQLAHAMDEADLANRCRTAFEQGSQRLDDLLWNGEFYIQALDDIDAYKYQCGQGCLSDQLMGQLHARILDLGDLVPSEHSQTAIRSIFNYNFRRDFHDHINCQRSYVLSDEAGLILCSWPLGGRPRFPFVYSDEVWTGIEYHVAAHLIYEGWLDEGLTIVEAARARHDGVRRNPWDEVECGHHYARSMSSWALLLASSGAHADLGRGELHFKPVLAASPDDSLFRTFWSTGRAWGVYTQRREPTTGEWQPMLEVLGGDANGLRVQACGREWVASH